MTIKILVPVKRVVDANVRVRINSSGVIDTTGLKMSMNPFDECAIEKALQLKEAGIAAHVTVVTCGEAQCEDILRTGLAMGADDAVLIVTGGVAPTALDSLAVARLIRAFMVDNDYGLVLCGKQAIDDDTGGLAAMLAALLGWPQALNACALESEPDGWRVTCGDDAGTSVWRLEGPSVISADLRLAEPRHLTLPSIVKAKKKLLTKLDASTLGVSLDPYSRLVALAEPQARQPGVMVRDAAALFAALGREQLIPHARTGAPT